MKRHPSGRLLAGTAVGQVLFDAATLAMAMSTHRDCALLQRYAHSNGDMSYPQAFVRQDTQTQGVSNDDILHRATMHTRMLMLADLWVWALDRHIILTCFSPHIGEDVNSDTRDLQREIHQTFSDQLHRGLGCTVENILTVILEVCMDTMFKGLTKDPQDIDLTWVAGSEISSLVRDFELCCYGLFDFMKQVLSDGRWQSHGADLRKHVLSNSLSTMTATTRNSRHSPRWTKRQKLVENENLTRAASLGNRIAQLQDILDLTSQQAAAIFNLVRVHNILEKTYPSDRGVMHLSKNIAFVQLHLRLERRVMDFEQLLRRAHKVKSCVSRPSDGERWESGAKLTTESSWMICNPSRPGYTRMTQLRLPNFLLYLSFLQLL